MEQKEMAQQEECWPDTHRLTQQERVQLALDAADLAPNVVPAGHCQK